MEKENAKDLFSGSLVLGFRYKEYICDGDLRVVKAVNELKPYGENVGLKKTECANHLVKRSRKKLGKWGTNWNVAEFEKRDNGRRKKLDDRNKKDVAAKNREERAQQVKGKAQGKGKGKRKGKGKGKGVTEGTTGDVVSTSLAAAVDNSRKLRRTVQPTLSSTVSKKPRLSIAVHKDGGKTKSVVELWSSGGGSFSGHGRRGAILSATSRE